MAVYPAQASASAPLAAQDVPALRKVFASITAESCPHSFNFHMHTVFSDGKLRPEELLKQAIALGLQGLAITDHHTTQGYQIAQRWLEDWQQQHPETATPAFWTGVEITASLLDTEVHILGYGFDPQHPALTPYLLGQTSTQSDCLADQVIASIQAAGGLAVLAHPARYRRSHTELIPAIAELGIDGIETYYAYNNPTPWQPSPQQTAEVRELGRSYQLLDTCGTDTHGMSLLQRL
jgi:predicted metal-dependent phosphoesterase TrpH